MQRRLPLLPQILPLLLAALFLVATPASALGRRRSAALSAFCYTVPLGRRLWLRPFGPHPVGLYKASDDDVASPFSNTSPNSPSLSSPSSSYSSSSSSFSSSSFSSSLSSSLPLQPFSFPTSSSAASAAVSLPYVHIDEAAHPLRHRSLRRSFSYFCNRVRTIFSSSSSSTSNSTAASSIPSSPSSTSPSVWPRLKEISKPEVPLLCLSALALLIAAAVEVSLPHYSSQALSAILQDKGRPVFFKAVARVFQLGVLAAITTGVRGLCFGLAGTRIVCRLRHALFKALLQQEIAFFDQNQSGDLTNRLTSDCSKISNVVSLNINILLRQSIQLLGGLVYLYRLHRLMAVVTGMGLSVLFVITGLHGRYNRAMGKQIQDSLASSNAAAGSSLSLIRVVRTHVGESRELEQYDQALLKTLDSMEAHDFGYGAYRLSVRFAQTGLLTAVLALGWRLTTASGMSMDQLTSALFYVQFVMGASFDVSDQYSRIQEALGSATQVFALLDRIPALSVKPVPPSSSSSSSSSSSFSASSDVLPTPPTEEGSSISSFLPSSPSSISTGASIVFSNVSFTYPLRPFTPILSSLHLVIQPGQRVAIVGASGGGKSTLLRLLSRQYDPDGGTIYLDGRDITTFTQKELSDKVATLSQEPPLMPISIKENIAYGLPPDTYTHADVEAAAHSANIHSFITSLPEGFDTVIGEGSVGLSGGEKQRVAIARALMRKPEVLLLDEPSSALDQTSQAIVQAALERAAEGRTTLIIAHRLSTVESCDSIIVLKNGAVVERGTHADLLAKQGVYAAFRAQQLISQQANGVEI